MVVDFRNVRRTIPKGDFFNIYYEDMLDQDKRVSIMTRLVDFIGTHAGMHTQLFGNLSFFLSFLVFC